MIFATRPTVPLDGKILGLMIGPSNRGNKMNKNVEILEKQIDSLSKKLSVNHARLKELESIILIAHLEAIRDALGAKENP